MTQRIIILLALFTLLLSACAAPAEETSSATAIPNQAAPAETAVQETVLATQPQPQTVETASCTVDPRSPTPNPTQQALIPPVSDADWVRGDPEAHVTFLVYSDFECPTCASVAPELEQLLDEFPGQLRVVYRHFPLNIHDKARLAAQAAEAAGVQGKFWQMHDLLFDRSAEWNPLSPEQFQTWVSEQAAGLGIDQQQFESDMNSEAIVGLVKNAYEHNAAIGMPGTPFFFINDRQYSGQLDYASFKAVVDVLSMEERQFTECPPMTLKQGSTYFATLKTEKGDVRLELYADTAPTAVNSFIFLARAGWFDGVTFHRVIPGFVAQAGDPSGTGYGGPGYAFSNEISSEHKFDQAGLLAMANSGPDSNGSQFFITYAPAPNLDGGYTIFGRVVAGMDVVENLTPRDPSQSMDLPAGDLILNVIIEEE